MRPRSTLVTGGSGFIGRHLLARLVAEGREVVSWGRRDPELPGVRHVQVSSFDDSEAQANLRAIGCDVAFHLAAYGVSPADRDPAMAFSVNIAGTAAAVQAVAEAGASAVVYAGSCSEYAGVEAGRLIVETDPLSPTGLYGASKAAAGLWGGALAHQLGIGFAHLRLFGVYGPGEAPHRLIPAIAGALTRGIAVNLSPGEQIRDVLHVQDVVEGLLRAERVVVGGGVRTFNVCSSRPVRIRDLACSVADAVGATRDLLHFGAIPVRPGEMHWLVGDGSAFAEATGFVPAVALDQGIASTVASFSGSTFVEAL